MSDHKSLNRMIQRVERKLGLKSHAISVLIWKDHIKERMAAHQLLTYEEYEEILLNSPLEMQELIELMVNPETWFFREKRSFEYLTYLVQQEKKIVHFLRILSLACSTGEEPYSIAMSLFDAGLSRDTFKIDAWDISHQALVKARMGIYHDNSFRSQDLNFRNRYFHSTSSGYSIEEKIKQQVIFYKGNILEEKKMFRHQSYQIIFCRNLLIYLHQAAQMELLYHIKTLLAPQGVLIVSSAETKIAKKAGFEPIVFPGANAFKIRQIRVKRKEFKGNMLKPIKTKKPLAMKPQFPGLTIPSLSKEISGQLLLQEAMKKADKGVFDEAMQLCFRYIELHGAHSEIYHLLGVIHHAKGNEEEAKKHLHRAVYLKPSHGEALIHLALLYETHGEWDKADLLRKRAEKYLLS